MPKNRSKALTDLYYITAGTRYPQLMELSRYSLSNKENLLQIIPNPDELRIDDHVRADYKSFLERQVLGMTLLLTLDGKNSREDMRDLVKGSKLEKKLDLIYESWDKIFPIEDSKIDEWIKESIEAVKRDDEQEDFIEQLLMDGQMQS